jgi:hypothetical protein
LLGNDRETNNETTAIARQRPALQGTGWKLAFSARSAPMASHKAMDKEMSGVSYAVHAEVLQAGQSLELSQLCYIRQQVRT